MYIPGAGDMVLGCFALFIFQTEFAFGVLDGDEVGDSFGFGVRTGDNFEDGFGFGGGASGSIGDGFDAGFSLSNGLALCAGSFAFSRVGCTLIGVGHGIAVGSSIGVDRLTGVGVAVAAGLVLGTGAPAGINNRPRRCEGVGEVGGAGSSAMAPASKAIKHPQKTNDVCMY